jgi:hypothetical protein
MDKEFLLREQVSDLILTFADEQQDLTRSDFQGRAVVVARQIIELVKDRYQPIHLRVSHTE